jgi:hypothetical protein
MTGTTAESPNEVAATTEPTRTEGSHVWDAFISYSHGADHELAPALRDALHRLAKPWYRKRALRVFLDEAAMSTEPALWTSIEKALHSSQAFVLLLSTQSAASTWVNQEVATWTSRHGTEGLLLVLTDGELVWDNGRNDFDLTASTAFPNALAGVFGQVPRHLDLRWCRGRSDLTLANPRFLDDVAELAAPLRGASKDELVGADVREHRRTMRITRAAIGLLSILLVVAMFAAVLARSNARRANARRIDAQAARLRGESLFARNLPDLGFLLAAQSYRMRPTAEAASALIARAQAVPDLRQLVRTSSSRIIGIAVTDDGKTAVSLNDDGRLLSIDTMAGRIIKEATAEPHGAGVVAVGRDVIVSGLGTAQLRDAKTLAVRRTWDLGGALIAGATPVGQDRVLLAAADGRVAVTLLSAKAGPLRWTSVMGTISEVTGSANSTIAVAIGTVGPTATISAIDPATQAVLWQTPSKSPLSAVVVSPDAKLIVVGTTRGELFFFDAATGEPSGEPIIDPTAPVQALASVATSPYVIATSESGQYRYIEPVSRTDYGRVPLHAGAAEIGWSPAGIAATGGADGMVAILGTVLNRIDGGGVVQRGAVAVAVSADGRSGASVWRAGSVRVHRLDSAGSFDDGAEVGRVVGPTALTLLGDGRVVVGDTSGALRVFDATGSSSLVLSPGTATEPVARLRPLSSDRFVSLRSGGGLQIWRVEKARIRLERTVTDRASGFGIQGTDGPLLAYFEGSASIVVIDVRTGSEVHRIAAPQPGSGAVALDPAGTRVAVADSTLVRVWDLATRTQIGEAINAEGPVAGLSFVDGRDRLSMVDTKSVAKLIHVPTGQSMGRLYDEDNPSLLGTSTTGSSDAVFVTFQGDADPVTIRRSFDPVRILIDGCRLFGRPFSDAERTRFDLDRTNPCDHLPALPVHVLATASLPPVSVTPSVAPQDQVVDRIVKGAQYSSPIVECVRDSLALEPWVSVVEIDRARQLSTAAFAARLNPFERRCSLPTDAVSGPSSLSTIAPFTMGELAARWNAAAKGEVLGRIQQRWIGEGATRLTSPAPGVSVQVNFRASGRIQPALASPRSPDAGTPPVLVGELPDNIQTVTMTIRPTPNSADAKAAVGLLTTIVEGDGLTAGVIDALGLDALGLDRPGTVVVVTAKPVRVGRAVYALATARGAGLAKPGLQFTVSY